MEARDICERTMAYAVRAVKVYAYWSATEERRGVIIGRQFLRAASSIGASVAEAKAAESRADFIHKDAIAQKEARECLYWLQLMFRAELSPSKKLEPLIAQTNELIAIVTTILVKLKRRK